MKKRLLIFMLVCSLSISFCACKKEENPAEPPVTTTTTTIGSSVRSLPDYTPELREHLGVEPEPSTFDELLTLSRAMKGPGFYEEDEEHHCCTLVYNNNHYDVIRYEKAKEWFEYRFTGADHLYFEEDNGRLIIRDDSYSGPEGMLMPYNFIAFVDNSCKYLIIIGGSYEVPTVSDADIDAFKNFFVKADNSVDQFKSFYGLDDRVIEDFILFQQITEDDLFEYDYSKALIESFNNGDYSQFGYSMNWNKLNFEELTLNNKTDITNAIDNARWIYMVFDFPIPDSDETERITMLSDFHHDMFYYDVDEDNYHNSGRQLALTELAKKIQVDMIPEDAERQNPDRDKYALSYKYDVYIFTYDRKYIHISNDTYYRFHQSFDVYWKLVYYREFDKEF